MNSLYVGIPSIDCTVNTSFLMGALDAHEYFLEEKIPIFWNVLNGESLITRARNTIANLFLSTKCPETKDYYTHLLMVDSDIIFYYKHFKKLLDACSTYNCNIIGGIYPLKNINWQSIYNAACYDGANPNELDRYGVTNVVHKLKDYNYNSEESIVPVQYIGTGMMCISRNALLKFIDHYPELKYIHDGKDATAFFEGMICPNEKIYLSEDYTFSYRMRKIGIETFAHKEVLLKHFGGFMYNCNKKLLN